MVIYNVTVGIDRDIEKEWLSWMKGKHIPDVMNCGIFSDYNIFKVLSHGEEATVSYSIQYHATSVDDVSRYLEKFAPPLVEEHRKRYKDKHVAFRSLLESVI
jgi:hypothetical protein